MAQSHLQPHSTAGMSNLLKAQIETLYKNPMRAELFVNKMSNTTRAPWKTHQCHCTHLYLRRQKENLKIILHG